MDYSTITEKNWNDLAREFAKKYARFVLAEKGDNQKASESLNLSLSTIEQMKISGKGSIKSWFKLLVFSSKIKPEDLLNLVENFSFRFIKPPQLSPLEKQFEALKNSFSSDELESHFRLLLAKKEIEKSLNIKTTIKTTKS